MDNHHGNLLNRPSFCCRSTGQPMTILQQHFISFTNFILAARSPAGDQKWRALFAALNGSQEAVNDLR